MRHAASRSSRVAAGRRKAARHPAAAADAAGQGAGSLAGQVASWLVLAGVVAALALMRQGVHLLRSGTLVLAGVLLAAAAARLVLPEQRAGMLASRRRSVDVTILTTLGVGLLVGGLVVPTPD